MGRLAVCLLIVPILAHMACLSSDDDLKKSVVDNYAAGAHASYVRSLTSAQALDTAIDDFLAAPS